MHSCKYYDAPTQSWIREYEDGHRQQTRSPVARAAAPSAARGLVMHRDTLDVRTPISSPQGTWIAQAPDGGLERLNATDYIVLSTPRIPQAHIAVHRPSVTNSLRATELVDQVSSADSWLLTTPVNATVGARYEPVAQPALVIDVVIDNSRGRRAVEREGDLVPDPRRPGHYITRATMRRRGALVPDPLRPGELVSTQTLRRRQDRVEDPRRPGEFISRRVLQRRLDVVDDPRNPGVLVNRESLQQREDRVEHPRRPGHFVTRKYANELKKRQG